ncbi:hypothetical protein V5799_022272 [Amblyomma americanum]|uniref:Uncharacterized protein n=1 Tax=Amblyomma americanum TaxID=6943 RepID=A0AAQ4FLG6_AMBAM
MAIFTTIACVSVLLWVILINSADTKLPPTSSNHGIRRDIQRYKRREYTPGERAEEFLLCTVGRDATEHKVYPPDGMCNWIIYTHVRFEALNGSLVPTSFKSWMRFLGFRAQYKLSRQLPSHEWGNFSLRVHQARSLNQTLTQLRMVGLAFLNVRVAVGEVPKLATVLETLANANPGMFLVLGSSFQGLNDRTASKLLPSWLLDQLVTPLSVFVLETHLPAPGDPCRASFSTAFQPVDGQKEVSLTFRGARAFLEQPALRYANPASLARCVSVTAGALVFHVVEGHPAVLGAPCSRWSLEKLSSFCRLPSVNANEEARAAYGRTESVFFSFEYTLHMWKKIRPVLHSLLLAELPTCMAVYSLDLDCASALCPFPYERTESLVYTAYDVMLTMTMSDSSDDSFFVLDGTGNFTNSPY